MKQFFLSIFLFIVKSFSRLVGVRYYTVEYRTSMADADFADQRLDGTNFTMPVFTQNLAMDYAVKGTSIQGTVYSPLAQMLLNSESSRDNLLEEICNTHGFAPERVKLVDVTTKRSWLARLKYTVSSALLAWGTSNG